MNNIAINLLPQEILFQRRQGSKLTLINKFSIGALLVMVFFASATLVLRLTQSGNLKKAEANLTYAENRIQNLKYKEGQFWLLKDRIRLIQAILDSDAKRKAMFNLIIFLTPPDVQISDIAVDKNGGLSVMMSTQSLYSIDALIASLADQDRSGDLVGKADMDGLTLGKNSTYRFSLKISPKQT